MLPNAWQRVQRLLVTCPSPVADAMALGLTLRSLHQALPAAVVVLLASPSRSQIVSLLPGVDQVLVHSAVDRFGSDAAQAQDLITTIKAAQFGGAIVFTGPAQSPYPLAYACYLAGIPLRLGQSLEFGGGVLSDWVKPGPDPCLDHNLYLLEAAGLAIAKASEQAPPRGS